MRNPYKIHEKYIQNTYKIHTKYIQNTYNIHTIYMQNTYKIHDKCIEKDTTLSLPVFLLRHWLFVFKNFFFKRKVLHAQLLSTWLVVVAVATSDVIICAINYMRSGSLDASCFVSVDGRADAVSSPLPARFKLIAGRRARGPLTSHL